MALKVYEAFNQIKTIKEELKILAFRDTLEKDPAEK